MIKPVKRSYRKDHPVAKADRKWIRRILGLRN